MSIMSIMLINPYQVLYHFQNESKGHVDGVLTVRDRSHPFVVITGV